MALAAREVGHRIAGVVSGPSGRCPVLLSDVVVAHDTSLPVVDLVIIATPDGVIEEVARVLQPRLAGSPTVAHLSGFTSIDVLADLAPDHGSLHPLMTLPSAERGAKALFAAPAAVTGSNPGVASLLTEFAEGLGMRPFTLDDEVRRRYHAAASVAANMTTAILGVAFDLFESAGVDPLVSRRLVDAAVANTFEIGPAQALTGPIVRGDDVTIEGQIRAAGEAAIGLGEQFESLVELVRHRVASSGSS